MIIVDIVPIVSSTIEMLTGLACLIFSPINFRNLKLDTIKEHYSQGESGLNYVRLGFAPYRPVVKLIAIAKRMITWCCG